jgi:hypothetical protein
VSFGLNREGVNLIYGAELPARTCFHEPLLLVFSDKQTGMGRPESGLGFWLAGFYK